jgi:hypothetical protein
MPPKFFNNTNPNSKADKTGDRMGMFDTYYCPNLECWYAKAQSNKGHCPKGN